MSETNHTIREATEGDISQIEKFILEHGPNEWNYLPPEPLRNHLEKIRDGEVRAVIAKTRGQIIGVITLEVTYDYEKYKSNSENRDACGYIAEAVVHRDHAGKGIGTELINEAIKHFREASIREVFAIRHEGNIPSAGMMRKAGMEVVDTFYDPDKRPTGSRQTTVCRLILDPPLA